MISPAPLTGRPAARPLLDAALFRQLEQLTLVNRRRLATSGKGERRSLRRGSSLEFVDYRQYTPGDDLRQIDWNVFGRLDNLVLKLFEDEEVLSVHFLIDVSRSMDWGTPNKLDYACQVAAALGYVALTGYDTVEVLALADRAPRHFGPARGRSGVAGLFRMLGELSGVGRTDLDGNCRLFAGRPRPPGLVLLFSDLLDPTGYEKPLSRLRRQGHEVVVLHHLSPQELRPDEAGDLRLVDRETGESMEVTIDQRAIDQYLARLGDWQRQIAGFCRRHNIAYHVLDTSRPLAQLLFRDLRLHGVLA